MSDKALGLAQLLADELYDVDVLHLVVAAYVVDLAYSALMDDKVDSAAVILNVQPVADIQTLAVYGERLVSKHICYHKGYQLLGEVIGTVVV